MSKDGGKEKRLRKVALQLVEEEGSHLVLDFFNLTVAVASRLRINVKLAVDGDFSVWHFASILVKSWPGYDTGAISGRATSSGRGFLC